MELLRGKVIFELNFIIEFPDSTPYSLHHLFNISYIIHELFTIDEHDTSWCNLLKGKRFYGDSEKSPVTGTVLTVYTDVFLM